MVCSYNIQFGENGSAFEIGGEIINVWDWVMVWNGIPIQRAVVSAWSQIT